MPPPNHQSIVEAVYAAGTYDLTTREGCGTLTEAACSKLHQADARWGHLKKAPGQTQYNGHAHDGTLYLDDRPGQSQFVDFIANAESIDPARPPFITWQVDAPRYSASDWYAPPDAPAPPATTCQLGMSLFWLMAGTRFYLDHLRAQLLFGRFDLGADYIRAIAVVGGDLFSGVDPWQFAGSFLAWPDWKAQLAYATDYAYDIHHLQVEWTLFGSRGQTPALSDCERVVDTFLTVMQGRHHKLVLVEVANEYNINGFTSAELRHLARRLRAGLPQTIPIALSSPGSVHACQPPSAIHAEVEQMYGGLPEANTITPHWCRAHHVAPDLGPFAPALVTSNEPRGPGASASGGDVDDPALLAGDYRAAIAAGYRGYVYHTQGGVWGGRCHPNFPDQNRYPNVFSSPHALATAQQLSAIRHGGAAPGPGPDPVPLPPRARLLPGEDLLPDQALLSPDGRHRLLYQQDGHLVIYGPDGPTWGSGTAGTVPGKVSMQGDGHLVIYTPDPAHPGQFLGIWGSGTQGHPGAYAELTDAGTLRVVAPATLWSVP